MKSAPGHLPRIGYYRMNRNTMDVNKDLLQKYYQGHCTDMEKQMVEEWLLRQDAFTGVVHDDNEDARARMWYIINANTIGHSRARIQRFKQYTTIAACLLVIATTGFLVWQKVYRLPAASAYIIIDNTSRHLQTQQQMGNVFLSESANGPLRFISTPDKKDCVLYTNSLIINNQRGEDIWVYLKTSSEKYSKMVKFLCRKKTTYVAGYITEHSTGGSRKYLYSKVSGTAMFIPQEFESNINSQLNAAKINGKQKGHTTIII
ncbi:hypothetical protein [Chitinophaga arvensicola]|uniref:Uncharacterized protein n=1 Tax=Chitinophaga arvensicola TaxID=29529 RepID=A0A1I0RH54_9BACT|nr:hypothetical protein [Chitinophaga arvensicola]SEW40130.1 hypothetical protein SAMN04488122_2821 [Chitinophaga arvensicola]